MRNVMTAASVLLIVLGNVTIGGAQTQIPPGVTAPVRGPAEVEGTVKKVDTMSGTVQVSTGLFGLFGSTLMVTSDTQIQVEGRQGTLADLREGAKVKAAYELKDGHRIARSITAPPAPAPGSRGQ